MHIPATQLHTRIVILYIRALIYRLRVIVSLTHLYNNTSTTTESSVTTHDYRQTITDDVTQINDMTTATLRQPRQNASSIFALKSNILASSMNMNINININMNTSTGASNM